MDLDELLSNITQSDIELLTHALRRKKTEEHYYNFDKMDDITLNHTLEMIFNKDNYIFDEYFDREIITDEESYKFLESLLDKEGDFLNLYSYENLKIKFIAPLLNYVNFTMEDYNIKDFYEVPIEYRDSDFILDGMIDFVVSKGSISSERPYFFIIAFREDNGKNPIIQLLAELISAIELSNLDRIIGACVSGSIWNFIILEKNSKRNYQYFISTNLDSSQIDSLATIYQRLVFIKSNIIQDPSTQKSRVNLTRERPKRADSKALKKYPPKELSELVWLDSDTELFWQRKHNKKRFTLDEAFIYVDRLNQIVYGGFRDWRIPSLEELKTLLTKEKHHNRTKYSFYMKKELIDDMDTNSSGYWSSTLKGEDEAWYIYFADAKISSYNIDFNYYIRCVRG